MSGPIEGIDPAVAPSGTGCVECLKTGGWWLHLRRCTQCGHIGCCDTSPSQHASAHYHETGHPVMTAFDPPELWFWHYPTEQAFRGPRLAEPRWRPADQPAPGPAGKVPPDWQRHLND